MANAITLQYNKLFLANRNKKIIIFGTGSTSELLADWCQSHTDWHCDIAYYVDNNPSKWGTLFKGKLIYSPDDLRLEEREQLAIIVASQYYEEIAVQLQSYGFVRDKQYYNGFPLAVMLERTEYGLSSDQEKQDISIEVLAARQRESGCNVVLWVLPVIPWDYRWQRPQQLFSRVGMAGIPVFYVDIDCIEQYAKIDTDDAMTYVDIAELGKSVYGITLPSYEYVLHNAALSNVTVDNFVTAIGAVSQAINPRAEPVYVVQHPRWRPLVEALQKVQNARIIYDYLDDFSAFGSAFGDYRSEEKWLLQRSDVITVSAEALRQKAAEYNQKVYIIRNGADYNFFSAGSANPRKLFTDDKPVIGYYGAIDWWFDTALVEFLIRERPNWNFVFIGKETNPQIEKLHQYANVHFLGEKPYSALPELVAGWDVCMIPFALNELTKATNPVKFYEYLSAGKSVVSTRLPELEQYDGKVCYLADNKEDFLRFLEQALIDKKDVAMVDLLQTVARQNTWDERVNQLISIVKCGQ